jgi:hypothetical protein
MMRVVKGSWCRDSVGSLFGAGTRMFLGTTGDIGTSSKATPLKDSSVHNHTLLNSAICSHSSNPIFWHHRCHGTPCVTPQQRPWMSTQAYLRSCKLPLHLQTLRLNPYSPKQSRLKIDSMIGRKRLVLISKFPSRDSHRSKHFVNNFRATIVGPYLCQTMKHASSHDADV